MENNATLARGAAALIIAAAAVAACGSPRRGEPLAGPLIVSESAQTRGQVVFMQQCHKCHPGGEAGLGPSLNNKAIPKGVKRFQVRHAIGAMPSFSKSRLSDKDFDDLAAFLAAMRSR